MTRGSIESIIQEGYEGRDGFIINWKFRGLAKGPAKFRARAQTAMRFPTTVTEAEVIDVERLSQNLPDPTYKVAVFVPTSGFGSAGAGSIVQWMKEQFNDKFRR